MSQLLNCVFPEESTIPDHLKIPQPIEQREYLINGELKSWTGNLNPVLSPVFVKQGNKL
jgi:glyceraldehyde-3-phosphate dehydrogenase (NADP+)